MMLETDVKIIRATRDDAVAIRELTRAAYAKWVPMIGREPKPMQADYDLAVQNHIIDLVRQTNTLVALIETIANDDHLLIENVAVSPAHQGRGYGRLLMAHAEQLARSMGYRQIRLYTNKMFVENIRLYSHLGYEIDREEAFRGGFLVHMHKQLS